MDALPTTVCQITASNGRWYWLYSDGTRLPVISGGDGSTEPPAGGNGDTKKDPTFTQDDLNRIAAREKDEGKRAALAEVARTLGCTIDEAAEIIKRHREADDKQKSEAERAREAADKEKADAEKEKAEAAREKHVARVERVLLKAGVPDGKLEKVARLLDAEVGADVSVLEAAAKDLKKEFPELFTGTKQGPVDSDPAGGPPKPKIEDDAYKQGIERAKQYANSSFGLKEVK